MTDFALMFNVLDGGVSEPIKWGKDQLKPNRSIIVLDESSLSLYLWHGKQQGLVQRRTALRQAQSLRGHGYTVGKSIIGRDIKELKEIDQRKVGRVPEDTDLNKELVEVLDREFRELDDLIVTFGAGPADSVSKPKAKPKPKAEPKPEPKPQPKAGPKPKPAAAAAAASAPKTEASKPKKASDLKFASEYDEVPDKPAAKKEAPKPKVEPKVEPKIEPKPEPKLAAAPKDNGNVADARIAFVVKSIMEFYNDIWVSKKDDGSIAVEMMDGPICQFSLKEGSKIKFTTDSFADISPDIKKSIQKKYVELNKLL